MTKEPQIKILSESHRNRFFWLLVVVFLFSLPALIFYTTGFRISFENEETTIVTTGGVYITTDNLGVDVYLDAEQVERPRLFRSAYYIQNIEAGQHRVVVQRPDLHTWVKELSIDSHIVEETAAFNMPVVPHIRPITKYLTATGTAVYLGLASTTELFQGVTTTIPVATYLSTKVLGYELNEEYVFVDSLFSSTTDSKDRSVFDLFLDEMDRFNFSTTTPDKYLVVSSAELVIERDDIVLSERLGELYAVWTGSVNDTPYYFCVKDATASVTAKRYGQHVSEQIERLLVSTTTTLVVVGDKLCRPEIKLDRLRQDVYFYDFFPNNSDLILLQLEDGLYVTEIDDRSWQNTQKVYAGTDFKVVLENDSIFILDDEKYFELITEIEPS